MIRIVSITNNEEVYLFQKRQICPYYFPTDYEEWEKSFMEDVDGEGRKLFGELYVKAAYDEDELIGFIQYGRTAFAFDNQGDISTDLSYNVIRNLYFDEDKTKAGQMLLDDALRFFGTTDKVYSFFHYFGMSCYARHGKLYEKHSHIEELLKNNGFEIEHENVYYSSVLQESAVSELREPDINIKPHDVTKGNQQYMDFMLSDEQVGGCEIQFVSENTVYLSWIYVDDNMTGKGIGTKCMCALKQWLYDQGYERFDTDTVYANTVAQHYYEKNGFTREGITRSFYKVRW